jgi:hypothetical protein
MLRPREFRRPEVHYQLELRGLLDRQVSRLNALEDLGHDNCGLPAPPHLSNPSHRNSETIAPRKGREWLQGHVVGVTADVPVASNR